MSTSVTMYIGGLNGKHEEIPHAANLNWTEKDITQVVCHGN